MPNYRFGRCDGRHEIIDFGLGRARCPWRAPRRRLQAGQIFLYLWYTAYCPPSWRPANLTASSLVENARTGPVRARITRPALVIRWILNGAGSGSPVGFLAAMCVRARSARASETQSHFQTGRRRALVAPIPSAHQAQLRCRRVSTSPHDSPLPQTLPGRVPRSKRRR